MSLKIRRRYPILKILLTAFIQLCTILSFAQDAEDLNKISQAYLEKKDYKNAIPLIIQAAEKGNAEAQYNLGVSYQRGLVVAQNDSIANSWFLKAARQGFKDAQFKMAVSYAKGRGITANYEQSFFWILRCAEQQDMECMTTVAGSYLQGFGTEKNLDSMVVWSERLALIHTPENLPVNGRITSARVFLASQYLDGGTLTKDYVKSYMWFLIYNESKRNYPISDQQQIIEIIQTLEERITQTEKEKAKLEAEKLIGTSLKNVANIYKQEL